MPGFDGTGPVGNGTRSGLGRGLCENAEARGAGRGCGLGRGLGARRGTGRGARCFANNNMAAVNADKKGIAPENK